MYNNPITCFLVENFVSFCKTKVLERGKYSIFPDFFMWRQAVKQLLRQNVIWKQHNILKHHMFRTRLHYTGYALPRPGRCKTRAGKRADISWSMCDAAGEWRERAFCEKSKKKSKIMATKRNLYSSECADLNQGKTLLNGSFCCTILINYISFTISHYLID